jgi:hypothetical protein
MKSEGWEVDYQEAVYQSGKTWHGNWRLGNWSPVWCIACDDNQELSEWRVGIYMALGRIGSFGRVAWRYRDYLYIIY